MVQQVSADLRGNNGGNRARAWAWLKGWVVLLLLLMYSFRLMALTYLAHLQHGPTSPTGFAGAFLTTLLGTLLVFIMMVVFRMFLILLHLLDFVLRTLQPLLGGLVMDLRILRIFVELFRRL